MPTWVVIALVVGMAGLVVWTSRVQLNAAQRALARTDPRSAGAADAEGAVEVAKMNAKGAVWVATAAVVVGVPAILFVPALLGA